jgi:hypothetical protein
MQLASHLFLVLRLRLHGGRFPVCFLVFIHDMVVKWSTCQVYLCFTVCNKSVVFEVGFISCAWESLNEPLLLCYWENQKRYLLFDEERSLCASVMLFMMGVTVCAVSYYDYLLFIMNEWVRVNMEHWWNDTDSRKLKYSKENFSQHHHFVHHKSYMQWLGIEPGPLWWQASN